MMNADKKPTGMEMMLVNMLKAFMPKESAEKIAGWANDGTFDRIGNLPVDVAEIKARLVTIDNLLRYVAANLLPGSPATGPRELAPPEHGTNGGPGSGVATGGEPDDGYGGSLAAAE